MTRKPDDWMPLHIGRYLANTSHLTRDQHGAYMLLLFSYWTNGGPIDADDGSLAATARATPSEWKRLRPVLAKFFTDRDGKWHQKKADEELAKARRLTDAKAAAGRKGAARKWQGHDTANGTCMAQPSIRHRQTDAPLPLPKPEQEKEEEDSPDGEPVRDGLGSEGYVEPEFEPFFAAFPKQEQAEPAARAYAAARARGVTAAELLDGARRYAAHVTATQEPIRFVRLAKTWLKEEGWRDSYGAATPQIHVAVDPSWGSAADRLTAALPEANLFGAYFAGQEFVDSDPPRIRFKTQVIRDLAERKCARALKAAFGEIILEVAA